MKGKSNQIAFLTFGVLKAPYGDTLHLNGSTPEAFNFRKPFDPSGAPVRLKMEQAEIQE
jgi:hypothetical protein